MAAMRNPFRYFNGSPDVIRLALMKSIGYPLAPRQVEDLAFARGIESPGIIRSEIL
jgi:putative transposase